MNDIMNVFIELKSALYTMHLLQFFDEVPWCEMTVNNRDIVTYTIYIDDKTININCDYDKCTIEYDNKCIECEMVSIPSKIVECLIDWFDLKVGD